MNYEVDIKIADGIVSSQSMLIGDIARVVEEGGWEDTVLLAAYNTNNPEGTLLISLNDPACTWEVADFPVRLLQPGEEIIIRGKA